MSEHILDRELRDLFADGPRKAPAATVDRGIDQALALAQRRPTFSRLDRRAWPPQPRSLADPDVHRSARVILAFAVLVLLVAAIVAVGSRLLDQRPNVPALLVSAGSMDSFVDGPRAFALPDGRVLITGAAFEQVIVTFFDPRTGESSELVVDAFVTGIGPALPLPDGRIFTSGRVAGGELDDPSSVVILDPATGAVTMAGQMLAYRFAEAQVVLADGRVLISGGLQVVGSTSATLASVEVFDPATATFSPLAPLLQPRLRHSMLALDDGRVLVIGGDGPAGEALDVEVYEPDTGNSTVVGSIGPGRDLRAGPPVRLSDGRVLIPGGPIAGEPCAGYPIGGQAMYLFDPTSNRVVPAPELLHFVEAAVATLDGRVVVSGLNLAIPGGCDSGAEPFLNPWLGVYDPDTGTTLETRDATSGVATLPVEIDHQYVAGALLPDGRVALIGGSGNREPYAVDLFTVGR